MNRFTKDLGIVDEKLPDTLFDTIRAVFEIIGVVTIVCISNYFILVPTLFIILALIATRHFYVGPVRAIKRAEALCKLSFVFNVIALNLLSHKASPSQLGAHSSLI